MAKRIERSAIVSFSAEQMFKVVNDIEAYPEFMPGCVDAEILERGEGWVKARLDLSKAGIKQSFVTKNILEPYKNITLSMVTGPFKSLKGEWQFHSLSESACKVVLFLEFEFANALVAMAAGKLFESVASEQVDALCKRAKKLY